ncbi:MAG: hypothetical protein M1822_007329 [Bathelium mastoideum]|nr:MAG: hypothetical protein M1822_007329 [Bathelium mastoideum]
MAGHHKNDERDVRRFLAHITIRSEATIRAQMERLATAVKDFTLTGAWIYTVETRSYILEADMRAEGNMVEELYGPIYEALRRLYGGAQRKYHSFSTPGEIEFEHMYPPSFRPSD